jgi:N-methylhydantoinase B
VSTEIAFAIHRAPEGVIHCIYSGSGREPAQSHGLLGGLPGCNTYMELHADTGLREALRDGTPLDAESLGGEVRGLPPQGLFDMDERAVLYARSDGGGGLGDPLLRATEAVLRDVSAGLLSPRQAEERYGVVLDVAQAAVDGAATRERRRELRAARIGTRAADLPPAGDAAEGSVAFPVAIDGAADETRCAACGGALGPLHENWKQQAVERSEPLAALGELWTSTMFVLRSYYCPRCGVLLDAEMTLPEDPPVHSYSPPGVQQYSPPHA